MIEADLQQHYRVDLCDLWRGYITLRKVRVLIDGLPPDGPTARALAGVTGPLAEWRITDALIGRLVDEMALMRWEWESAHLDDQSSHRPQPPSVLPDEQPVGVTATEVAGRTDIPLVSPHRLGAFIYDND